jgi:hypothetical protein
MSDDVFTDLPDDPELAFLKLLNQFEKELDQKLQDSGEQTDTSIFLVTYMNQVMAAASELGIDVLGDFEVPSANHRAYEIYRDFSLRVKSIELRINIRNAKRTREFSVEL